jgi:ABC-type nitrate/sulfonate/bicarbonate transport system ATPase subunit
LQIALRGIHKDFPRENGGRLAVLRDVTLTVEAGEFCCVVGSSGCGKSTILNIVAGLTLPDSGQVLVDDTRVESSRIRIGYVFQKPRLLNWKSVRENVAFALKASGVSAAEGRSRSLHYLNLVGLGQFENEFPLALSGGMQQRVAIARALAIEPDLLLMDEPFSHLDELTARVLRAELLRIWQQTKKPVMFVTHNALEAVYLADQVLILSGSPATISKRLRVSLPRDREMEDPRLVVLQREILDALGIGTVNGNSFSK